MWLCGLSEALELLLDSLGGGVELLDVSVEFVTEMEQVVESSTDFKSYAEGLVVGVWRKARVMSVVSDVHRLRMP